MNARILTTATFALSITAILPAKAADPQLLNLVMPDAKVLAGVNVDQAKATPFGVYVLSQMQTQDAELKKLETMTGFDPTRDVRELLVASNAAAATGTTAGPQGQQTGLFLARGTFDPVRIAAVATAEHGITEIYKGVTIIEDPKATHGVAFLSTTLVVAGDLANVKGAIDRQNAASSLPAAIAAQVNQWSTSQDAWAISTISPASLKAPATAPQLPGVNANGFQSIQSAAGGVKFGALVVVTAQAQAATAQDATQMSDALKMLVMLAQMQAAKDPVAASLAQSLQISASGNNVNVSASLPEDQLQQVLKPHNKTAPRKVERAIRQQ